MGESVNSGYIDEGFLFTNSLYVESHKISEACTKKGKVPIL